MLWLLTILSASAADDPFATAAQVHVLENGLTVILEESHRTDTVALNLAYGVGSRDEREGELGCAHLFEHLMFEGSANVPTNMFDEWLTAGGGSNNAWTSEDQTVYHETFPSGALDLVLFLESDRMGFLDAGINETNVTNQQKVVLQERNQGYAEPNGRDWDAMSRLTWSVDHPYHHPVIGTVADIEGFQVEAVDAFWRRHYRPRNAVLTLVGNFDSEQALKRVEHWFSDVPDPGDPEPRQVDPVPAGELPHQHGMIEDDVGERTVYVIWPGVHQLHPDAAALDLLGYTLSGGRGTRLDDALYYDKELATDEGAFAYPQEIGGQFIAYATHHKTPLKKLDKKLVEIARSMATEPPTEAELDRAKRMIRSWVLDRLEKPWDRAELLTDCQLDRGEPNCLAQEWARYEAVTPQDVARVAKTYLVDVEPQTLSIVPRGDGGALDGAVPVELP